MTGLLANYPRRFDLWNIFLDLEIKQGETDVIRYYFALWTCVNIDACSRRCLQLRCPQRRPKDSLRSGCSGRLRVVMQQVQRMLRDVLGNTLRDW